jgi:hypothetical protein
MVVSDVCSMMSAARPSLRTTNRVRLLTPGWSSRSKLAVYTPDTALAGTAQLAETAQLPQSTRPVDVWTIGLGWLWGSGTEGAMSATLRAPRPPYHPIR